MLVLLCSQSAIAQSRWTRLRSEHFTFVGEISERSLRDVAQNLERFREALSRVLPGGALATSVPTVVFVFQSDASLTPYKPTFQGKPVELAGFFSGWTDRNFIALNASARQSALRVVFHEYAHFLVQNTTGRLPPWANEGLAGFYETFQEQSGGKTALIGAPIREYLALLGDGSFFPLRDLLAIEYSSPEYNEGNRRSLFYAESWALMHYLQLGSARRAAELGSYLSRLRDGAEPAEAFAAIFGDPAVLERELRDYLRKFSFPAIRLDFADRVATPSPAAGVVLTDVESATYLSDLQARSGHLDLARARLEQLLATHPDASVAAETLGVLELNAGNSDRALPWLERAARDGAAAEAQVLWGRAVVERHERAANDGSDPGASLDDARRALTRAAAAQPDDAETLATLGRAESLAGEDIARALALLDRAVALAPGQEEYRMMLAEELTRQRQFTRATELLGPLAASARRVEIRDAARHAMSFIAERRRDAERTETTSRVEWQMPRFRVPRPNETRTAGTLTLIDCQTGAVVVHVETEDESLRLSTSALAAVQFISYRKDGTKSLACGAVEPSSHVYATYIESDAANQSAGIDGRVTAIEEVSDEEVTIKIQH
jgi:tetratricopeptide (TPR) repeat protein